MNVAYKQVKRVFVSHYLQMLQLIKHGLIGEQTVEGIINHLIQLLSQVYEDSLRVERERSQAQLVIYEILKLSYRAVDIEDPLRADLMGGVQDSLHAAIWTYFGGEPDFAGVLLALKHKRCEEVAVRERQEEADEETLYIRGLLYGHNPRLDECLVVTAAVATPVAEPAAVVEPPPSDTKIIMERFINKMEGAFLCFYGDEDTKTEEFINLKTAFSGI